MKLGISLLTAGLICLAVWFGGLPASARPTSLDEIIRDQQRRYVRESFGVWAHQCFTDADLEQFKRKGTAHRIAARLRRDRGFVTVVLNIKETAPAARREMLESLVKPLHQTWAQLGKISPEGQTEAGQRAEIMIARAIVDLAEELLDLSADKPNGTAN